MKDVAGAVSSSRQVPPAPASSTFCPGFRCVTPSPASMTSAMPSPPGMDGISAGAGYFPAICSRLAGWMGVAMILARTSPAAGAREGISLSCSTSAGLPCSVNSMTFILGLQSCVVIIVGLDIEGTR